FLFFFSSRRRHTRSTRDWSLDVCSSDLLPHVSSEFERMCACGRSVCTTTLGLRGSETSTAVKFFGALSCASQMMRRPSGAICTEVGRASCRGGEVRGEVEGEWEGEQGEL